MKQKLLIAIACNAMLMVFNIWVVEYFIKVKGHVWMTTPKLGFGMMLGFSMFVLVILWGTLFFMEERD